jgi:hypothetical protein
MKILTACRRRRRDLMIVIVLLAILSLQVLSAGVVSADDEATAQTPWYANGTITQNLNIYVDAQISFVFDGKTLRGSGGAYYPYGEGEFYNLEITFTTDSYSETGNAFVGKALIHETSKVLQNGKLVASDSRKEYPWSAIIIENYLNGRVIDIGDFKLPISYKLPTSDNQCYDWCRNTVGIPHLVWDGKSKWPDCTCICDSDYGWDGEKCVDCKTFCEGKGDHWIYDKEKSEPGFCTCTCEDGFKPDSWGECKKVECPENSTNVADLGSTCPKDRIVNRYCCCDVGYVNWYGVCIKEKNIPGKVVCGKWGCQEGEDCINCPPDCDCIPPKICDPLSKYADPKDKCSPKVAYIFVSSGLASYEYYWDIYRINDATRLYRSLGYKIVRIRVNDLGEIANELAKPSTKAIAYFGHGHPSFPSLESDGPITISLSLNTAVANNYKDLGLPSAEVSRLANAKSTNPNLDYAYIHACYSLGDRTIDTSLADYLLRPGGTYWGEEGILFSGPWDDLSEYVKP